MTSGLTAKALQARAAGAHDQAVDVWRALLAEHPDDWRLALELKRDLKAGWHYPESDSQFRRAAASLPDAEWLTHYGALYAYHGEDLHTLDRRARAMLPTRADDPVLLAIIGDVASQRRDWAASEAAFEQAFKADPQEEYRVKRDIAALYQRLPPLLEPSPSGRGNLLEPSPSGRGQGEGTLGGTLTPALSRREREQGGWESQGFSICFVNLDRNPERESEVRRQFAGSAPALHRSAGIEGRRLPAAAIRRLGGDPQMRGTLGCFLSHAGAWEAMLERGDAHCLVVEDDVIPLLDLPAGLDAFGLPPGFDLVFVNDRLSPRLDPAVASGFTTRPLAAAMLAFPPEDNAPGGDGYILSRGGARKLLDWVSEDGFGEDVDWRLIAYGLSPAAIAAQPRPSHAGPWLDRVGQLVGRAERLDAHVLHPPLIRTVGVSSDREDENRRHASSQPSVVSLQR